VEKNVGVLEQYMFSVLMELELEKGTAGQSHVINGEEKHD